MRLYILNKKVITVWDVFAHAYHDSVLPSDGHTTCLLHQKAHWSCFIQQTKLPIRVLSGCYQNHSGYNFNTSIYQDNRKFLHKEECGGHLPPWTRCNGWSKVSWFLPYLRYSTKYRKHKYSHLSECLAHNRASVDPIQHVKLHWKSKCCLRRHVKNEDNNMEFVYCLTSGGNLHIWISKNEFSERSIQSEYIHSSSDGETEECGGAVFGYWNLP